MSFDGVWIIPHETEWADVPGSLSKRQRVQEREYLGGTDDGDSARFDLVFTTGTEIVSSSVTVELVAGGGYYPAAAGGAPGWQADSFSGSVVLPMGAAGEDVAQYARQLSGEWWYRVPLLKRSGLPRLDGYDSDPAAWEYDGRAADVIDIGVEVSYIDADYGGETVAHAGTQPYIEFMPRYYLQRIRYNSASEVWLSYFTTWGRTDDRFAISREDTVMRRSVTTWQYMYADYRRTAGDYQLDIVSVEEGHPLDEDGDEIATFDGYVVTMCFSTIGLRSSLAGWWIDFDGAHANHAWNNAGEYVVPVEDGYWYTAPGGIDAVSVYRDMVYCATGETVNRPAVVLAQDGYALRADVYDSGSRDAAEGDDGVAMAGWIDVTVDPAEIDEDETRTLYKPDGATNSKGVVAGSPDGYPYGTVVFPYPQLGVDFDVTATAYRYIDAGASSGRSLNTASVTVAFRLDGCAVVEPLDGDGQAVVDLWPRGDSRGPSVDTSSDVEMMQFAGQRRPTPAYGGAGTTSVSFSGTLVDDDGGVFEELPEAGPCMLRLPDGRRYVVSVETSVDVQDDRRADVTVKAEEVSR